MQFKTVKEAEAVVGGLSNPSKMPGYAYSLPATRCKVGSELAKIPGSVCSDCYALKGRYRFPNVQAAQERRYQALSSEHWVDAMVFLMHKRKIKWFRWHDSGDLQNMEHLLKIVEVAVKCPSTKFWVPTRENALVSKYISTFGDFPDNLVVRVSGAMIDGLQPLRFVNTSTVSSTHSEVTCPAYTQGGKCGDCRMCWDRSVPNVTYPHH